MRQRNPLFSWFYGFCNANSYILLLILKLIFIAKDSNLECEGQTEEEGEKPTRIKLLKCKAQLTLFIR